MDQELEPNWSEEERAAGERLAQSWEDFFSAAESGDKAAAQAGLPETGREAINSVQLRYQEELLQYPNVVAVAEGIRTKEGKPTGEACLVVYVTRKVPPDELDKAHILPEEIDGVPVDVVEVGEVKALPT